MQMNSASILTPRGRLFDIKPILSISEVAVLLGKSVVTIRRYVREDEIPYRKRKRSTYFITEEVLAWLDQGD